MPSNSNRPQYIDWQPLLDWAETFVNAYLEAAKKVYDAVDEAFRKSYFNAGQPYGDTEEGYTRWLGELGDSIPDYRRDK